MIKYLDVRYTQCNLCGTFKNVGVPIGKIVTESECQCNCGGNLIDQGDASFSLDIQAAELDAMIEDEIGPPPKVKKLNQTLNFYYGDLQCTYYTPRYLIYVFTGSGPNFGNTVFHTQIYDHRKELSPCIHAREHQIKEAIRAAMLRDENEMRERHLRSDCYTT